MGTEERYSRAVNSSHLLVRETACDVDSLIAAGWIRDSLATTLYRLRVEFDACDTRSIVRLAPEDPPDRLAGEINKDARAEWKKAEHARIEKDFADRRLVAKALAMVNMKSLYPAKEAIGRFVMAQATREKLDTTPAQQLALAARIVDHILDPTCPTCDGVRFKIVPGTGRVSGNACETCHGSGKRKLAKSGDRRNRAEDDFARDILADLDRKMDRVNDLMRRFTSQTEKVKAEPLPSGIRAARPRLGADGNVFIEHTRDGRTWFRAMRHAEPAGAS